MAWPKKRKPFKGSGLTGAVLDKPRKTKATSGTKSKAKRVTNKYGTSRVLDMSYSDEWKELSRAVKIERGNRCERCPSTQQLQVHHIIPRSKGGKDVRTNLILLCHACHERRHAHLRD